MNRKAIVTALSVLLVSVTACGSETSGLPPAITEGPSETTLDRELTDFDRQYKDQLTREGIVHDDKTLFNAGKTVCNMMNHEGTPRDLATGKQTLARNAVPGIPNEELPTISKAAARAYCPRNIDISLEGS